MKSNQAINEEFGGLYTPDAFTRTDDTPDTQFYRTDRFVDHLDRTALATVEKVIENLVVEDDPQILDLMAGHDSHISDELQTRSSSIVGLGLNKNELLKNRALTEFEVHDINAEPTLPFADNSFDAVINSVSVDYLTRPFEVFEEIARILKPGGLHLVIFSNRMFPQKAIKLWRRSSEEERIDIVEDYFNASGAFTRPQLFVSRGLPRPADDKYSDKLTTSDPVYAMYAEKRPGQEGLRPDSAQLSEILMPINDDQLAERKARIKHTMSCPYCGSRLEKVKMPVTPFTEWDFEYMHVCFNDSCPYLVRGWSAMGRQGNRSHSYRLMYIKERDTTMPLPVNSLQSMKDAIEK